MKLWSLTLLVAAQLLGPVEEGSNKEGNDAYAAGELDDALTSYTQAQVEHPDARELHYNIGNVQFRKEDLDKALEQYKMALDAEPELKRRAHYNVGNIHYSREEWEDAVESYSDALRADPDDIDARQNLELALQKLSEQQQQQEGGGGDGDKDKDKEEEDRSHDKNQEQDGSSEEQTEQEKSPQPSPQERDAGEQNAEQRPMEMSQEEAEQILQPSPRWSCSNKWSSSKNRRRRREVKGAIGRSAFSIQGSGL